MMKLCEIVLNQLHTSAQLLHQLLSTINMSKRTHSEIVAPTTDPSTPAVESPKKRGRPFKKLAPLPREVMKALNILNAYVEKQQAQAQAASESDVASEDETPPAKRKGGWPKGKKRGPRKPKSTSPEVSEAPRWEEIAVEVAEMREKIARAGARFARKALFAAPRL